MSVCLSCYVGDLREGIPLANPAAVCLKWGSFHWPLCAAHAKIARGRYPAAKVVATKECAPCQNGASR